MVPRGTPEGGIILHWIVTIFYICVSAVFSNIQTGIAFTANLLIYGHFFAAGKSNIVRLALILTSVQASLGSDSSSSAMTLTVKCQL